VKLVNRHEEIVLLDSGDRIGVSVTHQIRINGDDSWVKAEASSRVRESESPDQAGDRVLGFVDGFVMKAVERVATTVEEYQ
jgi:hypothetical protein